MRLTPLFWPLAWILGRWGDPPSCLLCLGREHQDRGSLLSVQFFPFRGVTP
jgi:hypothetical protein